MNLLFIASSRIGDAILSTGALDYMIHKYPGIAVTVVAPALTLPLFEDVPNLKEFILLEKEKHHWHWIRLWQRCRPQPWDIIIDIRGSPVAFFLKAKKRYVWRSTSSQQHRVAQLGQILGVSPPPSPTLWLSSQHISKAELLIPDTIPVLVLSPAANWIGKQWSIASFQQLVKEFLAYTQAKIAIFAAPHEKKDVMPLINSIPPHQCLDLVGGLSLLEIAACLKRCRAFVGNDSGLMHMSAAVGTPTLGLFGPSNEALYAPYSPSALAPNKVVRIPQSFEELTRMPDFSFKATSSYMGGLEVKTVLQELKSLWERPA